MCATLNARPMGGPSRLSPGNPRLRVRLANTHIWMVGFDGKDEKPVTSSGSSESAPRWSPDGKYLTFTSSRPGKAPGNQVWILPRNGGTEAQQLTSFKQRLQSYEWSPDSTRLALVLSEAEGGGGGGRGARNARACCQFQANRD